MPNWCSNDLVVEGPARALRSFLAKAPGGGSPVSLSSFLPCPPELVAAGAGSSEIAYDLKYGTEWEKYKSYGWIPEEAKQSREAMWAWYRDSGKQPDADAVADRYRDNVEKHGHRHWYSWCVENWGTKWDLGEVSEATVELPAELEQLAAEDEDPRGSARFAFETAWGPPVEGFRQISEMFPELTFELDYSEPGMGFAGTATIRGGELNEVSREVVWEDECEDEETEEE